MTQIEKNCLSEEGRRLLEERIQREKDSGKGPTRMPERRGDESPGIKSIPGFETKSNPF